MVESTELPEPNLSRIDDAWGKFVSTGEIDSSVVRPLIADSWKRCRQIGLDPHDRKCFERASETVLKSRLESNREFIDIAWPLVEVLYKATKGSGFRVDLVDSDGYFLKRTGDERNIKEAGVLESFLGFNRQESRVGTCGIGLALSTGQPVQVVGAEHFNCHIHSQTCSSAPIRDSDGKVIGVLNITGHRNLVHKHTLGMVIAVKEAIERQFALKKSARELKLANEFLKTVIGSMNDGLIVIDKNGVITHFNSIVSKILGCRPEEVVGFKSQAIFNMFPEIRQASVSFGQEIQDQEVVIRGRSGSTRCLMSVRFINEEFGKVSGTAIILNKMERVHKLVQRMVGAQARFRFADIIGEDRRFMEAVELAKNAASTSLKILLQGESGTGKELFAEAIHNASLWRDGPFVAVNCSAVPRDLIESELFGYEEGAFTGARKGGKPGRFELAEKGTLFLDEVESMPLEMQPKLLRVLEDGQIVRVGGSEVIPVDVRVISATNQDLATEVENGNFRADLLYRLNSVTVNIPPLRERPGDIPLFVEHFLRKAATALMKNVPSIERKALEALCSYCYPGNVRELENIVERAVLVAQDEKLTLQCLPAKVLQDQNLIGTLIGRGNLGSSIKREIAEAEQTSASYCLSDLEKNAISMTLRRTGGNVSRAAKILGLGRNTLYRKIRVFGISNIV